LLAMSKNQVLKHVGECPVLLCSSKAKQLLHLRGHAQIYGSGFALVHGDTSVRCLYMVQNVSDNGASVNSGKHKRWWPSENTWAGHVENNNDARDGSWEALKVLPQVRGLFATAACVKLARSDCFA
jgi:hypothetical protein